MSDCKSLAEAVSAGNILQVRHLLGEHSEYVFDEEVPPQVNALDDTFVRCVLEVAKRIDEVQMEDKFIILLFFQGEWGRLSQEHRHALLTIIKDTYPTCRDAMCLHVMSELLGRFFCSHESLHVLDNLNVTVAPDSKSHLVLGYKLIASGAASPELRAAATKQLQRLGN